MKQATLRLDLTTKRARKREFLEEMNRVVSCAMLVGLVRPRAPEGKRGTTIFCCRGDAADPLHAAVHFG